MAKWISRMLGSAVLPEKQADNHQINEIDLSRLPQHVAIIMDGNGRWAQKRGLPRSVGHRAGVESLRTAVKVCTNIGIKYLTVYAFSTENWKRPKEEVDTLMNLLVEYLEKEVAELNQQGVQIRAYGDLAGLPLAAQQALTRSINLTAKNNKLVLGLCLNYGGRAEIVQAVNQIAAEVKAGKIDPGSIDEEMIEKFLYTRDIPDPDLLIRPAGELRISNYLLWQLAYTEFWLTDVLWPDFREEHFLQAIVDYQKRERRFGGLL